MDAGVILALLVVAGLVFLVAMLLRGRKRAPLQTFEHESTTRYLFDIDAAARHRLPGVQEEDRESPWGTEHDARR